MVRSSKPTRSIGVGALIGLFGLCALWFTQVTDVTPVSEFRGTTEVDLRPDARSLVAENQALVSPSDPAIKRVVEALFARLPLTFEPNNGQTSEEARFVARGRGFVLFLTDAGAVLKLKNRDAIRRLRSKRLKNKNPSAVAKHDRNQPSMGQDDVVRMNLVGAAGRPEIAGQRQHASVSHYLKGNDPKKWARNVSNFDRVKYKEVYPNTDLVFYGKGGVLEYDFVLHPGAHPNAIELSFDGLIKDLKIDDAGDLVLSTSQGDIKQFKPVIYQKIAGERQAVEGRFVLKSANRVGFDVAAYDTSKTLVIDPVIEYATFLGGNEEDLIQDIVVDSTGNVFVVGETDSVDFPASGSVAGDLDLFVAKLNASGSALDFATFIGGSFGEFTDGGLAVDGSGNIYVAGETSSSDLPVTPGAFITTNSGFGGNSFFAKLDPAGTNILYLTYLGGGGFPLALDVDGMGNVFIAGETFSNNFLVTAGSFQTSQRPGGGVFKSTNSGGSWLESNTGISPLEGIRDIALDPVVTTTLYAATNNGVFKSLNSGVNWSPANSGLPGGVNSLAIDPNTTNTIYAGTFDGIFKSTDGAGSWNSASNGIPSNTPITGILVAPGNSQLLFAGAEFGAGAFKSSDGGSNWTSVDSFNGTDVLSGAIHPSDDMILYVGSRDGLFKSTDGGATFSRKTNGFEEPDESVEDIVIDPTAPDTLFALTEDGLFKSTDGASSWSAIGSGFGTDVEFDAIALNPSNTQIIYLGTDEGGLFLSADGGATFTPINDGLSSTFIESIVVDPVSPSNVYIGTELASDIFIAKFNPVGGGTSDLLYGTYFGGAGDEFPYGLVVDATGCAHVAGLTRSQDLPTTPGAYQPNNNGFADAFLVKMNPAGTGPSDLVYSTYLGGALDDAGSGGVALDGSGNVLVAGWTRSPDFPVSAGAAQVIPGGVTDMFVAKLNPAGGGLADLIFATFLGGAGSEEARGIATNSNGRAYVIGTTNSVAGLPLVGAFQTDFGGSVDAFFAILTNDGTSVAGSSYLGGSKFEFGSGIAVDSNGNAYLVGETESTDFPDKNAFQGSNKGFEDGFIAKIAPVGIDERPVAAIVASPEEGLLSPATLTVTFDGSGSNDPTGGTIVLYNWDFGDGTTTSTATPTTTHVYSAVGSFAVTLTVQNSAGTLSDAGSTAIVVGDGLTGDGDLFTNKANLGVNFKNHRNGTKSDTFKLTGTINPNGLPADPGSATVQLFVNGVEIGPPTNVRSARSAQRSARKPGFSFIPIIKSNGAFSFSVKGADLRPAVGVRNQTGEQTVRAEIKAVITGVTLKTPTIKGVIETSFKTKKNAASRSAFSFIKLRTPTGAFKSLRTTISEGSTVGAYRVVSIGPMLGEFSAPLFPNGDITITIGDNSGGSTADVIIVPFAAFKIKGVGAKSTLTYSKTLLEIPALKKFQISNTKRKFVLATNELLNTGIPGSGVAGTTFELPIVFDIPTATGVQQLSTTVEIKRVNSASKKWKR